MNESWERWIKSYQLPDDIHWYKMNGKLIFTLSGYHIEETNYVYLSDLKDNLVNGIRLDTIKTEEELHKAIANKVLKIQIDLAYPKSYKNFRYGDKIHVVAP